MSSTLMFDGITQKEYGGKAPAPCNLKLSLSNQIETLQESRSYINDEVKRIRCDEKKRRSIEEKQKEYVDHHHI